MAGLIVFNVASSHVDWLTAHGVRAAAVVVGNDGAGCEGEDTPHVQVEFSTVSGDHIRDSLAIGGTGCTSYVVGKHVAVYYNPANPSDAAVGGGDADIGAPGWIGLALLVLGVGAVADWVVNSNGVRGALATVAQQSSEVTLTRMRRGRVALAAPQVPVGGDLQLLARGDSDALIAAGRGLAYCAEFAPGRRVVVQADDFVIWGRLRKAKKA